MRRLGALATTAATALAMALLVLAAPPASAGGPTSVLVVNYDGSRAAGALTGSTAYADLEKALDPHTPPTGDRTSPASFMGTQIRLTWMIHDVTPWRVDAISIDGKEVWVETTMGSGTGTVLFDVPSVRHRPRDPALLVSTLTALGVLGEKPAGAARPEASAPESASESTPDAAAAGSGSGARSTGSTTGAPGAPGVPWWGAAGATVLALGLGLVLGRRVRPRREGDPLPSPAHGAVNGPGHGPIKDPGHGPSNGYAKSHADSHDDTERVAPVGFTADPGQVRR